MGATALFRRVFSKLDLPILTSRCQPGVATSTLDLRFTPWTEEQALVADLALTHLSQLPSSTWLTAGIHLTQGYRTNALVSSIPHEVHPNPLGKQVGATFFHELPVPPPPPVPRVVVGAEAVAVPVPEERDSFVVGHTGEPARPRAAPAPERKGIVIGLSHNDSPTPRASRPRALPAPAAPRRNTIVIGSSRRRRQLLAALHML